jgi:hypothetical protein
MQLPLAEPVSPDEARPVYVRTAEGSYAATVKEVHSVPKR